MSSRRRRLRVVLLTHEALKPPASLAGLSEEEIEPFKTEYDVRWGLEQLEHEISIVGISDSLAPLRESIKSFRPHVVFNLLEEFRDQRIYSHAIVSYLELLRVPYTGCGPRGMALTHDKALSKKILQYHRIRAPRFVTVDPGRKPRLRRDMDFPLIVKGLAEESSEGISEASVVYSQEKLRERVEFVHRSLGPAIVEQYIPGREVYCAVLGNRRAEVLPLVELEFKDLRPNAPFVATSRVKWNLDYQKKIGVDLRLPEDLREETVGKLEHVSKRAFRILELNGWSRLDFRVSEGGEPYFLEANPNADIAHDAEVAFAAEAAGYTYPELIQRILNVALRRAGK
jgi:D-alanine-D-alanine ligase